MTTPMKRCGPLGEADRTKHLHNFILVAYIDHLASTEGVNEPTISVDTRMHRISPIPRFLHDGKDVTV